MKCVDCEYFQRRKDSFDEMPTGVCSLPSAPKYIITGNNEKRPRWCLRNEKENSDE